MSFSSTAKSFCSNGRHDSRAPRSLILALRAVRIPGRDSSALLDGHLRQIRKRHGLSHDHALEDPRGSPDQEAPPPAEAPDGAPEGYPAGAA